MADDELKRLLEGLFSDIPLELAPAEAPPEDAAEQRDAGELEKVAARFQAAARLSQAASSILDLDELLPQVVNLIREEFDYYYVGIFLADENQEWAALRAGTGEAGRQMLEQGHRLKIGNDSMIGWCTANKRARIALDVGTEAIRFVNPFLPETRSEMALPLLSRDRLVGAMTIQSTQPAAFSDQDITILQTMAGQLANAIENARLFRRSDRRIIELAIVNEIGQVLSSAQELDALLQAVHQQVSRLFDTTNFYIATYDEGDEQWTSAFHLEGGARQPAARYGIEAGLTGHIIRSRRPLLFRSATEIITFNEEQGAEAIGEIARSWLGVPLITADKLVGVMAIQDYNRENLYTEEDLDLFSTLAAQVATALDNLRLLEEARRRAQQLEAINEVGRAVTSVLDLDSVLRQIVDITKARFGHYYVSILLVEGSRLVFQAGSTVGDSGIRVGAEQTAIDLLQGPSLNAEAARSRQPVLVNDVLGDPRFLPLEELPDTRAELDVPIEVRGRVIGVLGVQSDWPFAYGPTDVALLQSLASQAGVAIENARLFEQTQQRLQELSMLFEVSRALAGTPLQAEEIAGVVARQFVQVLGIQEVSVSLPDPEEEGTMRVVVDIVGEEGNLPREESAQKSFRLIDYPATARAMKTLEPLVAQASDPDADPAELAYMQEYGTATLAVIPLAVKGQAIGVIELESSDEERYFTPQELSLAMTLANQVAVVLENARLFEEAQLRAEQERLVRTALAVRVGELDCLNDIGRKIDEAPPVPDLLQWVVERIPAAMQYPDLCRVAIQFEDQVYGATEAVTLPCQTVQGFLIRGREAGRVCIAYTEQREFLDEESALLGDITRRVSGYIENQRLLQETQTRAEEQAVLNELGQALSAHLSVEEVLAETYRGASRLVDTTNFYIGLYDPDRHEIRFAFDVSEAGQDEEITIIGANEGLAGYMIRHRTSMLLEDHVGQRQEALGIELVGEEALSWLGVPLIVGDRVLGAMAVQSFTTPRAYDEHDRDLLTVIASLTAIALQNAYLFEETQSRAEEQTILRRITETVSRSLEMKDLLETTLAETLETLGFDAGLVSLPEADTGQLYLAAEKGLPAPMARTLEQQGLAGTLCDFVFQRGETVFISDVRQGAPVDVSGPVKHGLLTYLGIPLEYRWRKEGTLCLFNYSVREATSRDIALLEAIGRQLTVGIENARLFEQTQAALAEVEATHRSYLRRGWQDHLRQREMLGRSGFLYDQRQAERPEDAIADPSLWRPELERALMEGRAATSGDSGEERSGLAIPITLRGQTFGVLGVESPTRDHQWSEDDIALVQAVGEQLAQTLETARLFADTQRRAERERLISEITTKIRASADIKDILETTAVELGRALGTSRALVRLGVEDPSPHAAGGAETPPEEARPADEEKD